MDTPDRRLAVRCRNMRSRCICRREVNIELTPWRELLGRCRVDGAQLDLTAGRPLEKLLVFGAAAGHWRQIGGFQAALGLGDALNLEFGSYCCGHGGVAFYWRAGTSGPGGMPGSDSMRASWGCASADRTHDLKGMNLPLYH